MRTMSLSTFVLAVVAALTLTAQGSPMQPGRWQRTTQMEMPGMPFQMPPTTSTECLSPAKLQKDPNSFLPSGPPNSGAACKTSDVKTVGRTVSWKMECTGQQAMTAEGEMTFMGDSYAGTLKAKMAQGDMAMKLSGKRIGDCTE